MSRIFNILITHKGKSYPALLTIAGDKKENSVVRVITGEQRIEVVMDNGSLSFSTAEVVKQLLQVQSAGSQPTEMHITPTITLQLLNSNW